MTSFNKKSVALSVLAIVVGMLGVGFFGGEASAASLADDLVINPSYTKYVEDLRAGRGANWKLIPKMYLSKGVDDDGGKGGGSLPSKYNLVDAGYGTTLKNQGMDGDCWAYATTTAMESYMKKVKGVAIEFSPKQLDYMTAKTRYAQYLKNTHGLERELAAAGNFVIASVALKSDYAPDRESVFFNRMQSNDSVLATYDSFREFNDYSRMYEFGPYKEEMTDSLILGNKAEYVVDGLTFLDSSKVEEAKEAVYKNGAAYVGTFAPGTTNCWDEATKTIIDRGNTICGEENGHAMAIIGWDDSHSYTDPSTGATKTGAFILQNSYGDSSIFEDYELTADDIIDDLVDVGEYDGYTEEQINSIKADYAEYIESYDAYEYVYLAYDLSEDADFGVINSMTVNRFSDVYDVTRATVGYNDGKIRFSLSSSDEQYITRVGFDLLVSAPSLKYVIEVDNNNDGIAEGKASITPANNKMGRMVVDLDKPVAVSGGFTLSMSIENNGNTNYVFDEGSEELISMLAYAEKNVASDNEDDVLVPNTGNNTIDEGAWSLVKGGIVVLPIILVGTLVGLAHFGKIKVAHRKFD